MFSYSQVRPPTDDYHVSSPIAIQKAIGYFNTAIWRGRFYRLWLSLQRQPTTLFDLTTITNQCKMINCHGLGIKSISIHEVKGSEGRCFDFDTAFFPIRSHVKDRWVWIAALFLMGSSLPAIETIKIRDFYFVRDGHHRISVSRRLGIEFIDANITAWDVSGALPWEN